MVGARPRRWFNTNGATRSGHATPASGGVGVGYDDVGHRHGPEVGVAEVVAVPHLVIDRPAALRAGVAEQHGALLVGHSH